MAGAPTRRIELWSVTRLKPYGANPRLHSAEQVDQIAASFAEFGQTQLIVVDEKGEIIAGHGRLAAALKLGWKKVKVGIAVGWSEAQKRAYRIADNQLTLLSSWDESLLSGELIQLKTDGFDLSLLGFDEADLLQYTESTAGAVPEDETPPLPAAPFVRRGDLWALSHHRLLCGDATDENDVGILLGVHKPHLMVTDPPYGVDYDPAWRDRKLAVWIKPRSLGRVQNDGRADWSDAWALFPGDVAYAWSPLGPDQMKHFAALTASGFEIRCQIIWVKPHFVIGQGNYHSQHEPCWYAVRKGKTAHWSGARDQSTTWQIPNAGAFKGELGEGDGQTGHGTQKPVECMKRPIENNSKPGQYVYDPFVGSGTTIIAAEMTARRCLAMDLDPAYAQVAIERWRRFTGKDAMLGNQTFEQVRESRMKKGPRKAAPVQEMPAG